MKISPYFDENKIKALNFSQGMVASAMSSANKFCTDEGIEVTLYQKHEIEPMLAAGVEPSGARFIIPVAIPEGVASGDERSFEENSITVRNLPLPLMWQIKTGSGHEGSVVVGRIDSVERIDNGLGNVRGVFDVGPYGREAERMVRGGFLRGVSVDLDKFKAQVEEKDSSENELSDKNSIENDKILVKSARLMGITIVPKPAFQECYIMIDDEPSLDTGDVIGDGVFEETQDDYETQLAALAASAAPVIPPRDWFNNPNLKQATPLTITDDGRVFGHIASWQTSHIGLGRGVKPPRSASKYAYFRTGELRTTEGDIQVGQLTLAGGHASLQASAEEAIKHYDDTASAVADVTAGEDQYGIWVAGALRPDVTPAQVRAFRASSPSGDWRPINGRLELVAVCQVNVPGFPIARAITASGGVPGAMVAAGASYLAQLRETNSVTEISQRLKSLEQATFAAKADDARTRMASLMASRDAELAARADAARARMNSKKVDEAAELSAKMEQLKARFNNR